MSFADRQDVLFPGERVVWEGAPAHGLIFQPLDVFLVPFSFLWGGFALFWNLQTWTTDAPLEFKLFGLPFLVAGVYVIAGRFLLDMWIRRGQHYFVTDRRILIVTRAPWRRVKSLDLKRLPGLELRERGDGGGTIKFGNDGGIWTGRDFGIWSPALATTPQFIRIENVRRVYDLIDRAGG